MIAWPTSLSSCYPWSHLVFLEFVLGDSIRIEKGFAVLMDGPIGVWACQDSMERRTTIFVAHAYGQS
jgi:hypothetical protein